jgi:hypothetical protein
MGKKYDIAKFIQMKGEMERVAKVIEQLKSLPNCYSCSKTECEFRLVDDSLPSRYNCPLYLRDNNIDIVENI